MSSIKIDAIDAEWLAANIDGKILLKAVGKLLGGKKRSKKGGDGDSTTSKPVSEALKLQHERTSAVAALLKTFKQEVKDEERDFDGDIPLKGLTFKVVSYLKHEETIDEVIEAEDIDAVAAAVQFLAENPEWKAKPAAKKEAKKSKAKAAALSDSESDEEEAPKPKAKAKAKKEEKPKEEKPKKEKAKAKAAALSDSEDEAPKAKAAAKPKEAKKPAAKAVLVSDSESEEEAPKPKANEKPKVVEAKPKAAAKPKEDDSDSDSEEEKPKAKAKPKTAKGGAAAGAGGSVAAAGPRLDDMVKIQWEGKDYHWDQDGDGALYEGGKRVGSFDGSAAAFA